MFMNRIEINFSGLLLDVEIELDDGSVYAIGAKFGDIELFDLFNDETITRLEHAVMDEIADRRNDHEMERKLSELGAN